MGYDDVSCQRMQLKVDSDTYCISLTTLKIRQARRRVIALVENRMSFELATVAL